jgi:hypothetical protein
MLLEFETNTWLKGHVNYFGVFLLIPSNKLVVAEIQEV